MDGLSKTGTRTAPRQGLVSRANVVAVITAVSVATLVIIAAMAAAELNWGS